jgi:trehalose-phosphatase
MPECTVDQVVGLLGLGRAGLATDFDGTVSPIVSPPEAARPLPGVEASLQRLVDALALVAVVSGRSVVDLMGRIVVPGAVYVGNHGLESWQEPRSGGGPTLARPTRLAAAPTAEETARLAAAAGYLAERLHELPGARLEDKGVAVAIHYRDVLQPELAEERLLDLARQLAGDRLELRRGKLVIELVLPRGTNKGTALERLAQEQRLEALIFIGDDLTDCDGFAGMRRLRARGVRTLGLAVQGAETPRVVIDAADATLAGPPGVAALLVELAARLEAPLRAPA